jgi:hypothetical protein
VLGARHPRMFAREWGTMLKSFKSEKAYEDVMDEIASRPSFETMQKAKLQLTDLENMTTREEGFMSNLAEEIPGIGRGVRASGRAYTAFLNKFRADAFDNYMQIAEKQGLDIEDPQVLKSIASWVNHATGRGSAKSVEGAMAPLNALFFSPRLIMSRVQLLNPAYYAKLDPFARKQALQGMGQLLGAVSLTLYMAKMMGAEVGLDPRSADFAKIKLGNTRIDIAGGFQQYLVNGWRVATGETVNSETGEVRQLEGGFGKPSRYDIIGSFGENKLAPIPGYGVDWAKNENFAGDSFNPLKETARLFVPLGAENAYEGFKASPKAGVASLGLGSIGFGVQTYNMDPKKAADQKKKARLAARGPSHVRDHEDRVSALKKEWKAHNLPEDPAAVKGSRAIRNMDLAKKRAEKKKGDKLSSQEKARLAFRQYKRVYPERASVWQGRFTGNPSADEWQDFYEEMRGELAAPFKRYDVNMDGS